MSDFENTMLKMMSELSTDMRDVKDSISSIDNRLSNVESRLSNVENRLGNVENKVDKMQSDINNLVRKTDILEMRQNDTQEMLSKIGATLDKKVLPKLDSLYDGYLHNKDVTFRLVTSVDTNSKEDIDILKNVVQEHSDRLNKLENKIGRASCRERV